MIYLRQCTNTHLPQYGHSLLIPNPYHPNYGCIGIRCYRINSSLSFKPPRSPLLADGMNWNIELRSERLMQLASDEDPERNYQSAPMYDITNEVPNLFFFFF